MAKKKKRNRYEFAVSLLSPEQRTLTISFDTDELAASALVKLCTFFACGKKPTERLLLLLSHVKGECDSVFDGRHDGTG